MYKYTLDVTTRLLQAYRASNHMTAVIKLPYFTTRLLLASCGHSPPLSVGSMEAGGKQHNITQAATNEELTSSARVGYSMSDGRRLGDGVQAMFVGHR